MFPEIRKSINAILYERTTSPLYGTFIVSWSIWNWKIIYLTLFVSEKKIITDKINYIITNCCDIWINLWFPLISTLVLITAMPLVSNGAYWVSLKYNKWKTDKKHEVEIKQLLTIEQSIALRNEMANQEEKFEKIVEKSNQEIKELKLQIESFKLTKENDLNRQTELLDKKIKELEVQVESNKTREKNSKGNTESKSNQDSLTAGVTMLDLQKLATRIKSNNYELQLYDQIMIDVQNGYEITNNKELQEMVGLLDSYDILKNIGSGKYERAYNGKILHRMITT